MKQKAFSLDKVTVCKILRSLFLSFLSGLAVFVTVWPQTQDTKLALMAALAAILAPFLPNTANEYVSGEKR